MERLTIQEIIEHCKRKTESYEKIIGADYFNIVSMTNSVKEYWEHKQVSEYLEELMKYRKLEEQGRLLKLPCNVGDTVVYTDGNMILEYEVYGFLVGKTGISLAYMSH